MIYIIIPEPHKRIIFSKTTTWSYYTEVFIEKCFQKYIKPVWWDARARFRETFYNCNVHCIIKKVKYQVDKCKLPLTFLKASIILKYRYQGFFCVNTPAPGIVPTQEQYIWCGLVMPTMKMLPPRAPDTIFSANADVVDNRGKGPGLSTLSSKCTHCYFLSTLLLYFHLWNIGQCGWFGFRVSGPFLIMTKRWGFIYWPWRVQVLWKMAKNEHRYITDSL